VAFDSLSTSWVRPSEDDCRELTTDEVLVRSGVVAKVGSGIYGLLPLGQELVRAISAAVRAAVAPFGPQPIRLPVLQPVHVWDAEGSGRLKRFADYVLATTHGNRRLLLAPSNEELFCSIMSPFSPLTERRLPLVALHEGPLFRQGPEAHGFDRAIEFPMIELHALTATKSGAGTLAEELATALARAVSALGVEVVGLVPDGAGALNLSVAAPRRGRVLLSRCLECASVSEAPASGAPTCCARPMSTLRTFRCGQARACGTQYAAAAGVWIQREQESHLAHSVAAGLSPHLVIAAAVEQNVTSAGVTWPVPLAPVQAAVLAYNQDEVVTRAAAGVASGLRDAGCRVTVEDASKRSGRKRRLAEFLGVPVVVSVRSGRDAAVRVEVTVRGDPTPVEASPDRAVEVARVALAPPSAGRAGFLDE
jgi:prolyl-tRNA synthetase